jgi:hypothetical protein
MLLVRLSEHFRQRLFALGRLSADTVHFAFRLFLNGLHDFPPFPGTSPKRPKFYSVGLWLMA